MMAEFEPVRRPAHTANRDARARTLRRRWRLSTSAALITVLALITAPTLDSVAAAAPVTATAAAPTATTANDISVAVNSSTTAPLRPGEDLALTVTIANGTSTTVPVGTIDITLAQRALTTRAALQNWLRPERESNSGDLLLRVPTPRAIAAGDTLTMPITVPAASVGLTTRNAWGARGVAAALTVDTAKAVEGRGTFVWDLGGTVTPTTLTTVLPITTPAGTSGTISAADLTDLTAPSGPLSLQLDSVINRPVAIAIDPMIIASIRVLGNGAPASAIAWLERLSTATNDIFPLGYADTDSSLQSQAGAPTVLAPLSLDQLIDPAQFATPTQEPVPTVTGEPTTQPDGTATTTPAPTEPDGRTLPTTADLLAWNYTSTDITWPRDNSVSRTDLSTFADSGLTTTILAAGNARQSDTFTPNSLITYGDGRALVTDSTLSAALNTAARATTDADWRAAVAEARSLLAIVSAEDIRSPRTLLATFDRLSGSSANRIGQTMDALFDVPWAAAGTLENALGAAPATTVEFRSQTQPDDHVSLARQLLQRESEIAAFSASVQDPLQLTADSRLNLLALLGTQWSLQPGLWQEQVTASLTDSTAVLTAVTITTRGPINVAADKVPFPITLRNELGQPVTVRVQVVPSNGRLLVESDIDTTIDANSAQTITVPVTAAVGNGDVDLRVTMFTPAGIVIGQPAVIAVSVHADWEGIGAWIVAAVAFLFFGFGIWRNIVRRRKERRESALRSDEERGSTTQPVAPAISGQSAPGTHD